MCVTKNTKLNFLQASLVEYCLCLITWSIETERQGGGESLAADRIHPGLCWRCARCKQARLFAICYADRALGGTMAVFALHGDFATLCGRGVLFFTHVLGFSGAERGWDGLGGIYT